MTCEHGELSSACCITCFEEKPPPPQWVKARKVSATISPEAYLADACAVFSQPRAHKMAKELVALLSDVGEINAQQDGLGAYLLGIDFAAVRGLAELTRLRYLLIAIRYLELAGRVHVARRDSITGSAFGNRLEGLSLA